MSHVHPLSTTQSDWMKFPPLEQVNRPSVPTRQAAYYLQRAPQTLRKWACKQDGPINPDRLNGRLSWRIADIRAALGA